MSRKVYSFILVLIFSFIVCVSNVSANKISEANIGDYIKMTPTSTIAIPLAVFPTIVPVATSTKLLSTSYPVSVGHDVVDSSYGE